MKCNICKEEARYIHEGKAYCCDCFVNEAIKNGDVEVKKESVTIYKYGNKEYWESPNYTFENNLDNLIEELETDYDVEFVE